MRGGGSSGDGERTKREGVTGRCRRRAHAGVGMAVAASRRRERGRWGGIGEGGRKKEQMREDMHGCFCKYLLLWRHMACHVARLGPQMKHVTELSDPDARFESSGTQAKLRNKCGDLWCNLLFFFAKLNYSALPLGIVL